jgi:hypothetical protein
MQQQQVSILQQEHTMEVLKRSVQQYDNFMMAGEAA